MSTMDAHRQAAEALREVMDKMLSGVPVLSYRVGSWLVLAVLGDPHPGALAVLPAPDGDEQEVRRGITTGTLRAVPMSEIIADGRDSGSLAEAEYGRRALARLGSAGAERDDLYFALVADAYAQATALGDKRPIRTLALVAGVKPDTMRIHVREARSRGLLTGAQGRAEGELTEHAKQLLGEAEQ
jgi:hypothetical protein